MSWKNVKQHYRIVHQVHVTKAGICIGSGYIHDLIVIDLNGAVVKRYTDERSNADLARYQKEMDEDPIKLRDLVRTLDTFTASIPVYTYDGAQILAKFCEATGWPNVTHDGEMMYENTFSTDLAKVIGWAKRNAELGVKMWRENVDRAEKVLIKDIATLRTEEANLAKLLAEYP